MKKRLVSLALTLAMCLTLTVPAFAAESKWKLEVPGKTDAEVFVGEQTFTVRDWVLSWESRYNAEYDYEEDICIATKTDSRQYTAENVYVLAKGDTAVFTKGGESFDYLYMTAWSDPDGDGVYDSRLANLGLRYDDDGNAMYDYDPVLPADTASPQSEEEAYYVTEIQFGRVDWERWNPGGDHPAYEYGNYDFTGFPALTVTEVKMAPDLLLELFGPNTLVSVGTWDWDESTGKSVYNDVCTILVEGNVQPAQPTGIEAMPTNDKLTVNGVLAEPTVYKIDGGNYFKLRDLAVLLNGTSCQFDVGYDAATNSVTADSGKGYTKLDSDMQGPAAANQTATLSNDKIIVNGQEAQVEVYKIDGGNYFKLRDLGAALGFDVGWDDANKVASITTNG